MFVCKINPSLLRTAISNRCSLLSHVKYYRVNTVAKRGSMLAEFVENRDKRNKWHFNIVSDKPKARAFDKIHKPHRRRAVLNSLFIRNITDVISTGDAVPELANFGIEITGVTVSPCFKILNVFWQVPVSKFDLCNDISEILTFAAPKIRAELISRNVLGRVPFIYFLRDGTNAKVSAFEKAMQNLDLGPESDSNIVVDDSFTQDIFSFKRKVENKATEVIKDDKKELTDSNINTRGESNALPQRPPDMKCDIFGLNHDKMMEKVIAVKKKKKEPRTKTALITPENLEDGDLFDKIPGICFEANSNSSRDEILKQFQVQRKMLKQQKTVIVSDDNHQQYEDTNSEDFDNAEIDSYEEDFIDDENNENSRF